jgi:hypothetical protein
MSRTTGRLRSVFIALAQASNTEAVVLTEYWG